MDEVKTLIHTGSSRLGASAIKMRNSRISCFKRSPYRIHGLSEYMNVRWVLPGLILTILLFSQGTAASLIGDEVSCFYDVDVGVADFTGDCSTEESPYTPGSATVTRDGFLDPEFYLGADIFGPGTFLVGIEIDVGADYFEIAPAATLIGTSGDLFIELDSLNWQGDPTAVIGAASLSGTGLGTDNIDLTHTADSVAIEFSNFFVAGNTFIRVDLNKEAAVPLPGSINLLLLAFGLLGMGRLNPRLK